MTEKVLTGSSRRLAARGMGDSNTSRAWRLFVYAFLVLLPLASLWPALGADFVDYDDPLYVTDNRVVRAGLTAAGLRWALTTGHAANWHPVTWLSHMLDVSLFGMDARGHHATNLAFHILNTLLLFFLFRTATGQVGRSAVVAALFAIHPAHVESVAWVTERKDVLSTAFWLGTMLAYSSWVRRRGAARYLLTLLLFAAGLMSKPMLVSLPIALLLFDGWPLRRFEGPASESSALRWRRRIVEKIPLLALAALSSFVTFIVQRAGGAVGTLEKFPLRARLENAAVSLAMYVKTLFWPTDLAVFYPHPGRSLPPVWVWGSVLGLLIVSSCAFVLRRKAPWFFFGWFWYLITLLPVIGIVQVGLQARADRYTYVPFIGLLVALVWSLSEAARRWRYATLAVRVAAVLVLATLGLATRAQARIWKNSGTLLGHAIAVTKGNFVALNNLAHYYNDVGRPKDALPLLFEALRIRPNAEVYNNIGRSLFLLGRLDEADRYFVQTIRLEPGNATSLNNLARVRFLEGDVRGAVDLYRSAVEKAPQATEARKFFAITLFVDGQTSEALAQLEQAHVSDPGDGEVRRMLDGGRAFATGGIPATPMELRHALAVAEHQVGDGLLRHGHPAEAFPHLRLAVELAPDLADAHNALGGLLLQAGRVDEAAVVYERFVSLEPRSAIAHNNLGFVRSQQGHLDAAIEEYRKALELDPGLALAQRNLRQALAGSDKRPAGKAPAPARRR